MQCDALRRVLSSLRTARMRPCRLRCWVTLFGQLGSTPLRFKSWIWPTSACFPCVGNEVPPSKCVARTYTLAHSATPALFCPRTCTHARKRALTRQPHARTMCNIHHLYAHNAHICTHTRAHARLCAVDLPTHVAGCCHARHDTAGCARID